MQIEELLTFEEDHEMAEAIHELRKEGEQLEVFPQGKA